MHRVTSQPAVGSSVGQTYELFQRALQSSGIDGRHRLAVALSGGPDSLALACLTSRWASLCRGPGEAQPLALVMDHQLRAGSRVEAGQAAEQARGLGFEARVGRLDWGPGGPPRHGRLLPTARERRYQWFQQALAGSGVEFLLLGHHAGDQAESFLIRLSRASGITGLQAMLPDRHQVGPELPVRIVRPLLHASKAELQAVCRASGLPWAEDPTNRDASFLRNAVRRLLERFPENPDPPEPLSESFARGSTDSHQQQDRVDSPAQAASSAEMHSPAQAAAAVAETAAAPESAASGSSQDSYTAHEPQPAGSKAAGGIAAGGAAAEEPQPAGSTATAGGIAGDMLRLVGACQRAEGLLEAEARGLWERAVFPRGQSNALALHAPTLLGAPPHVAERVLVQAMQEATRQPHPPGAQSVKTLLWHMRRGRGALKALPQLDKCRIRADRVDRGFVVLSRAPAAREDPGAELPRAVPGQQKRDWWDVT